jgi:nickel superoxide dismutase
MKTRENRKTAKKLVLASTAAVLIAMFAAVPAFAHCEIPCGIYDDQMRVKLMYEHLTTIEKSMKQAMELSKQTPANYNQIVRWITNKEVHASELQHIVTQYYMTQRIKFDAENYDKKLAALHKILVYAMKCKQTTNLENVEKAREAVKEFEKLYFGHSHD